MATQELERLAPRDMVQQEGEHEHIPYEKGMVSGARLSSMIQSLLYKTIMSKKEINRRRETYVNLDMTQHAMQSTIGRYPSYKQIWPSLKKKDISLQARVFLCRRICTFDI